MGFGEEYQGMTEREILIEIATKQVAINDKVNLINCPRGQCADHEKRLTHLETIITIAGGAITILALFVVAWFTKVI